MNRTSAVAHRAGPDSLEELSVEQLTPNYAEFCSKH
jgi:hypothetical protein